MNIIRFHAISLSLPAGIILLFGGIAKPCFAEFSTCVTGFYVQTSQINTGTIHVSYMDSLWGSTGYMQFDGETWGSPVILPSSNPSYHPFTNPDVAIGSDIRAQIVYGVKTGEWPHDLDYFIYAKAVDSMGTAFSTRIIGNDGYRYDHYDIAIDEDNLPHMVYGRSSKYAPYCWDIVYRSPDGTEQCIAHTTSSDMRCMNPCITYGGSIVHIAWIQHQTDRSDIFYAWGNPGYPFSSWQITYHSEGEWVSDEPDIGICPTGGIQIVYLVSETEGTPPYTCEIFIADPSGGITSQWSGLCGEGTFGPNIAFGFDGMRYISWSANGTAYINGSSISQSGHIDVSAGISAYYFRVHGETSEILYDCIGPDAPVASIDSIIPSPIRRGIDQTVTFWGTGYDTDEDGEAIVSWEWASDLDGSLGTTEDITLNPIQLSPGTHTIRFSCRDDEGVISLPHQEQFIVFADTIPPAAVDSMTITVTPGDTVIVEWNEVEDNLALDYYQIHRQSLPWFIPDLPIAEIDSNDDLLFTDGEWQNGGETAAYYLIIPVDIDGNTNPHGDRAGVIRYSVDIDTE